MSATFWNMRRKKLRNQLGIVREIKEEVVTANDMVNVKPSKPAKKQVKKNDK